MVIEGGTEIVFVSSFVRRIEVIDVDCGIVWGLKIEKGEKVEKEIKEWPVNLLELLPFKVGVN